MKTGKGEIALRRALRRMAKRDTGPLDPKRTLIGTLTSELRNIDDRVEMVRQYILAWLETRIEDAFDLEELAGLCFDLGVKFENLPGETLMAKTTALVNWADSNGRMDDLVEMVRSLRPDKDWS